MSFPQWFTWAKMAWCCRPTYCGNYWLQIKIDFFHFNMSLPFFIFLLINILYGLFKCQYQHLNASSIQFKSLQSSCRRPLNFMVKVSFSINPHYYSNLSALVCHFRHSTLQIYAKPFTNTTFNECKLDPFKLNITNLLKYTKNLEVKLRST